MGSKIAVLELEQGALQGNDELGGEEELDLVLGLGIVELEVRDVEEDELESGKGYEV